MAEKARQHYLFVTYPIQSHINPTLHLAKHLASSTGASVTFSTALSGHRRMVSSVPNADQEFNNGLITYLPFSDGNDEGFKLDGMNPKDYLADFRKNGQRNVSAIVGDLAAAGRPVTCIVYTLLLTWVVDVADEHGIPSVLYWIQPATVFAIYYHYFHGFESIVRAHADEPSFTVCFDLPSFLNAPVTDTDSMNAIVLNSFRDLFQILDREQEDKVKPRMLMNTFEAWETEALASVTEIEIIPVGQWPKESSNGNIFKEDEKKYMEWLDTKEEGSVVYVSFGSLSVMKNEQKEEMLRGLKESKRPFLWVVRKDNREEGGGVVEIEEGGEDGMVVEWCSQVRVLAHSAVGCFVTHCGWNSTLESLVCGVPMVAVPQWSEQCTNAKLVESLWGCGVRSEVDGDGVLRGEELVRCLELVMGEGEKGVEIRNKAKTWREKALEAVAEGGSCVVNLKAFVDKFL
ncbi:hypothetical protein J5N97_001997 [Dioscorea zingiberensis]|uniref:Glycosyltransferase n=1 Tax=Dioscorea zingiberensis TaxID=325984 RepID=A0A9D5BVS2_9LILI|nr:hypothetical protein J5N97_001997 [Dioscorea zingiberensis]